GRGPSKSRSTLARLRTAHRPYVPTMAKRHSYGEGSLYRRSTDGRWYGAVDVAGGTGRRRRVTVSGPDRDAVAARLTRLRRRQCAVIDHLSVDDWLRQWRNDLLPGTVAAQGTLDNYAWAIAGISCRRSERFR